MEFVIEAFQPYHKEFVQDIFNRVFGEGFVETKDVLAKESYGLVCLINGKVIGFAFGKSTTYEDLTLKNKFLETKLPHDVIELLDTLAVLPEYRRKGYGEKLFKIWLEKAEQKKHPMAIINWIINDKASLKGLAEANGFISQGIIHNYWLEDSINNGFSCLACGNPPCTCSAEVFIKL